MSTQENLYVRDASGKFYLEVKPPEGGDSEFVLAEEGIERFDALTNGKGEETGYYRAVRNAAEYERQRETASHLAHFGLDPDHADPQKARQKMRSVDSLSRKFAMAIAEERAPVGGGGAYRFEVVTDEKGTDLMAEAHKLLSGGAKQADLDFLPFSTYGQKLVTKSGKQLRQVFKGEVGMRPDGTIVVLEKGYGEGDRVQSTGIPEGASVEQKDGYTVVDTRSSVEGGS